MATEYRVEVWLTAEEISAIEDLWVYYPKNPDRHPIFNVREKMHKAIGNYLK